MRERVSEVFFLSGVKVGQVCSFCCEWAGPPIERCPKQFPDHAKVPLPSLSAHPK